MSVLASGIRQALRPLPLPVGPEATRVALIGSGQVARAMAAQVDSQVPHGAKLALAQICNSRADARVRGKSWQRAVIQLDDGLAADRERHDRAPDLADGIALVIDASASDVVAAQHARWLGEGRAVVTANKLGLGGPAERAARVQAQIDAGAHYGDSATVGAGLGAIARLRAFVACGEPVHEIAGVLSGSLAWLFDRFDGRRPFAELVDEARALGLTEPDPRQDLAGLDVARKLRILARAAGWTVTDDGVKFDPLLNAVRAAASSESAIAGLAASLSERFIARPCAAARLAVVARATPESARITLEWLGPDDPLAQRRGCENAVQIRSRRYAEHPLLLRGPGAGPQLTAAALLEDALASHTWRARAVTSA
jgi:homoserine dehydrogenase